nr:serine carboxypeptidase-like 31 isoform X2 [Ziziphus jujuba var. spinosa]
MEFVSKVSVLALGITALFIVDPVLGYRHWKTSNAEKVSNGGSEDLVTDLPGQPHVDFRHYAGYVTVNQTNERALFYWFYEAASNPDGKPLVLWLNGGPGCSSVGYGATQEIGPFLVTDSDGIQFNSFSWNTANDAYTFLHNWFLKFPSYRNRTFYIAGESYAGKYVPELAELIYDNNKDPSLHIELKGILLGNPETSDAEDWRGLVDYAWSHAVISDETHKAIIENCDFNSNDTWSNKTCNEAVDEVFDQYKEIDIYSLYTSVCLGDSASSPGGSLQEMMMKRSSTMMPRIMGGYDPCLDGYAKTFYNRPDVQKALHVSNGIQLKNWSICNNTMFEHWSYSKSSVLPIYKKLIAGGLRIWVYSGDTDGRVPVLSTRYSLKTLGLPITKPWRPWYHQQQVSGWVQEYKGLTFATFRGAGHAVPCFKPENSLAFFAAFLQGSPPPSKR